jgi:hypothetical protein
MLAAQYTVVTSDDLGKFEDRINLLLEEGWILQGGVATSPLPEMTVSCLHVQWSQAMVLPSRPMPEASAGEETLELPHAGRLRAVPDPRGARPEPGDQVC